MGRPFRNVLLAFGSGIPDNAVSPIEREFVDQKSDGGHPDWAHDGTRQGFENGSFRNSWLVHAATAGNGRKHDGLEKVAA
jgi:hypothetical protein